MLFTKVCGTAIHLYSTWITGFGFVFRIGVDGIDCNNIGWDEFSCLGSSLYEAIEQVGPMLSTQRANMIVHKIIFFLVDT